MNGLRGLSGVPQLGLSSPGELATAVNPPRHNVVTSAAKEVRLPKLVATGDVSVKQACQRAVVLLLPDDSGSCYGSFGTDPNDVRDAAGRSLLRLLRNSGGGRAGVIRWGSRVGLVQPVVDVTRNKKVLERSLSAPLCLGGTNPASALERAAHELPPLAADETAVIFLITDGTQPPDTAVASGITTLPPGSVNVLIVDRSGACSPELEDAWRKTPAATVTRLTTVDTKAMATELANTFAQAVGLGLATNTPTGKTTTPTA